MLQNIVFQDNLYQLTRSIETLQEGLLLDLSKDYFFDKTVDDLLFFDVSIQKMFRQIQANTQISGYISILQNLYTCQDAYLKLEALVLDGKSAMHEDFLPLLPKLKTIKEMHLAIRTEIQKIIQKSDKNNDSRDIVSPDELSELLHF